MRRDLAQRSLSRPHERRPQQQILGRIARDGELGEENELGAVRARLVESSENAPAVSLQLADDRVDLGQSEPHRGSL